MLGQDKSYLADYKIIDKVSSPGYYWAVANIDDASIKYGMYMIKLNLVLER
jgi:hypothetical protein